MSHWHYAMLELIADDLLIRPTINPDVDLSRADAHSEVGRLLARIPGASPLVQAWARGAKDDTVFMGPFTFTIFECDDCSVSVASFLDGHVATLRAAGVQVQIAQPPLA